MWVAYRRLVNVNEMAQCTGSKQFRGRWNLYASLLTFPAELTGMFLDLKTIWNRVPDEPDEKFRIILQNPGPRRNTNRGREQQWENRRRRIGVLFSKHNGIWNFIVLIGPGDNEMGFSIVDIDSESEIPNMHMKGKGLVKCLNRVHRLQDIINLIDVRLKHSGPEWIETLARAIIIGWGEFLREMRSEIIKVEAACLCSPE